MAECCNSKSASSNDVQNCIGSCSQPNQVIQHLIEQEFSQFQNRLQRCSMACQDEVHDRYMHINTSNQQEAEKMMKKCSDICADKHIAMLKSIKYSIEQKIDDVNAQLRG